MLGAIEAKLGKTAVSFLLLVLLLLGGWGVTSAYRFAAGYWKGAAETATANANTAQHNAAGANTDGQLATAAASGAIAAMAGVYAEQDLLEERLNDIENRAPRPRAADGRAPGVDPDLLRELEGATDRARAAQDRVRGANSRR